MKATPSLPPDALLAFDALARCLSFTAAANDLGCAKSRVSQLIKELEQELGTVLVLRNTRRVVLTESGQRLARHAEKLRLLLAGIRTDIDESKDKVEGPLRIGCSAGLAQQLLGPLLAELAHAFPELQVRLQVENRVVDPVVEGLDFCLRTRNVHDDRLVARPVGLVWEKLYASPDYLAEHGSPHTLDDLQLHRLISNAYYSEQGEEWRLERDDQQTTIKLRPALTVDQYSVVASVLKQHHGIGLLPSYMGQPLVEKGILAEVLPDWRAAGWPVFLVFAYQQPLPRKYQAFMSFIIPRLQDTLGSP
jgi:DNA-binding transcriptional LysR family regulator